MELRVSAIEHIWHAFDVVEGYVDSSDPVLSIARLKAECTEIILTPGAKLYAPMSGMQVKILQPSRECLRILQEDLDGRYIFDVTYLEVAADLFLRRSASRAALRRWLLGHLTFKHVAQPVVCAKGTTTFYYGRRTGRAGKRRPRVGVIYKRLSKLAGPFAGRKCVHVEMRLSGADALRAVGVFSIADLIDFDYAAFWPAVADLRRIADNAKLGHLIGGRSDNATAKALQKRARTLREQHRIGRAFVLHNALRTVPRATAALEAIDFEVIFRFGDPPVE